MPIFVELIWNDLPCVIKTAPTLNTFKSRYDNYVKKNPIFSSFRNAKLKKEENVEKKAKNKIDQRKKCPLF